jgi:hypothetical protein
MAKCAGTSMVVQKVSSDKICKPLERTQKFPLRPPSLNPSLTDQCNLQIQTILANFIQKPMIKVVN